MNRRWSPIALSALGLTGLTLVLMLLLPLDAANTFSTIALPFLAWAAAALNYWVLRHLHPSLPDHRLVRRLLPASVLWALGETAWGVLYASGLETDPSIADVFWLLGDVVFLYTLLGALRWYPRISSTAIRRARWGILLVIFALSGAFVLWPIAQEFTPEAWLKTLWALAYPLFDTALLVAVVTLTIQMRRGQLWRPWLLIALSVVAASFADLLYTYLDWNDLYYAETTGLLSRVTDWLFLLDYILYGWGMEELRRAWSGIAMQAFSALPQIERPSTFTNTVGLLYLDGQNQIIGYAGALWEQIATAPQEGRTPADLWPAAEWQTALETLRREGKLFPLALTLPTKKGIQLTCWISGVAVVPGKTYEGANLLLRGYHPGQFDPLAGLSDESAALARFLARETGVTFADYRRAMQEYTQALWAVFLPLIAEQLGPDQARAVLRDLNQTHGDAFRLALDTIQLTEQAAAEPNIEVLRQRYLDLLDDLRRQVEHLLSKPVLFYELAQAEQRMDASLLWMAQELDLRLTP